MWIWKIQRYLDFISWLKRRTNFQIQIMRKNFPSILSFFFFFLSFFVSIYVLPIMVLDYVRQRVKDRVPETKYRINRVRTEVEFLIKTGWPVETVVRLLVAYLSWPKVRQPEPQDRKAVNWTAITSRPRNGFDQETLCVIGRNSISPTFRTISILCHLNVLTSRII